MLLAAGKDDDDDDDDGCGGCRPHVAAICPDSQLSRETHKQRQTVTQTQIQIDRQTERGRGRERNADVGIIRVKRFFVGGASQDDDVTRSRDVKVVTSLTTAAHRE